MNREIKFRAWHIPTKKMFNVFSWCQDCVFEDSLDGAGTSPTLPAETKDCVLLQYTGLKDKNGVEIYDGDILAGVNGSINGNDWLWGNYEIKYQNGNHNVPIWGIYENQNSTHWFEIIGNIYENPELLKP
jgi:uncharacterized phage protein (TIGR01671 family)